MGSSEAQLLRATLLATARAPLRVGQCTFCDQTVWCFNAFERLINPSIVPSYLLMVKTRKKWFLRRAVTRGNFNFESDTGELHVKRFLAKGKGIKAARFPRRNYERLRACCRLRSGICLHSRPVLGDSTWLAIIWRLKIHLSLHINEYM
jgi:hypothetical protein